MVHHATASSQGPFEIAYPSFRSPIKLNWPLYGSLRSNPWERHHHVRKFRRNGEVSFWENIILEAFTVGKKNDHRGQKKGKRPDQKTPLLFSSPGFGRTRSTRSKRSFDAGWPFVMRRLRSEYLQTIAYANAKNASDWHLIPRAINRELSSGEK